ncbi:hypothetical protein AAF712_002950 [Marasmius tenuissimus]|uniref:Uncharacterized protein n=1 Tax=Marasmius tenuissimus TaxID=585030 RepID=A0ABR2Z991_9AGAR
MLTSRSISRNGDGMPRFGGTKTPGRGLQNENAIRNAPMTLGKGKANIPQTPFQAKGMKGDFKDGPQTGKGKAPIQLNTISRPFLDKTPFPNRIISLQNQTPFQRDLSETPDSAQRPSSTRKHIRLPRHSQKFETPLNTKHHWDISDDELELAAPIAVPEVVEVKDDYDEVEYMAPNTLDLPYQPPFDLQLPNYREVGQTLMGLSRNLALEEPQPLAEISLRTEDIRQVSWDMIPLPELEDDDPFRVPRKKEIPATKSGKTAPARSAKPVPVPNITRTRSIPPSTRPQISRPATSASTARPAPHVRAASTSTSTFTVRTVPRNVPKATPATSSKPPVRPSAVATSKTTASSRRPATSASTYKPSVSAAPRPGSVKAALTTGPTRLSQRPVAAQRTANSKSTDADLIPFKVDATKDVGDDFLFDV